MKPGFFLGAVVLLLATSFTATSANLNNTAQVVSSCSIRKIQDLNFGIFNPLEQTEITANGQLELTCTKGTYRVYINFGNNSGWYSNTRMCFYQIRNAQGKLALYYPSATPISNTTGLTNSANSLADCASSRAFLKTYEFTESLRRQTVTVYAYTQKSQFVGRPQVGTYTDTLLVSVDF